MTDRQVHDLFARMRWGTPDPTVCPRCGIIRAPYWIPRRRQWRCRDAGCAYTFSVTSGTKFADHKMPLRTILEGIALFSTHPKGISATQLSVELKISPQAGFTLLHKLRETLLDARDTTKVTGLVHVDGAHFSGRPRKPKRKNPKAKAELRKRIGRTAFHFHPNRRIVMVLREVSPVKGEGARRTVVEIVRAEDEVRVTKLGTTYIEPNSTVMTDESPAYGLYHRSFKHYTVNHSREFVTPNGVSNNQAESFFTRCRRLVIGQLHRITPKYLLDYMNEMAWREDRRRVPPRDLVNELLGLALTTGTSKWWRGYWQGHNRDGELLFG